MLLKLHRPVGSRTQAVNGFTLVETLVGIGLAGIVISVLTIYLKGSADATSSTQARAAAIRTNKQVLSIIKRDQSYGMPSGTSISSNGFSLAITRQQTYNPSLADASYKVTYQTTCTGIPSAASGTFGSFLSKIYGAGSYLSQSKSAFSNTKTAPRQCLSSANCGANQVPALRITTNQTGSRIPSYQPSSFPDAASFGQPLAPYQGSLGTAVCSQSVGPNKIRITVENAFATSISSASVSIGVVSDEMIVSLPDTSSDAVTILGH